VSKEQGNPEGFPKDKLAREAYSFFAVDSGCCEFTGVIERGPRIAFVGVQPSLMG
jgi:hypothetical protein